MSNIIKYEIGDEVRVINSWDDRLYDKIGVIKEKYNNNDYLVIFEAVGMAILNETELQLFSKIYTR